MPFSKIILPEEQVRLLIDRYNLGESMFDIATSIGRSKNYVRDLFISKNVLINKSRSMSNKRIGKPSHRKGKKHSAETINKMKLLDRSHYKTTLGRKYTEEQKQRMKDAWALNREHRLSVTEKNRLIAVQRRTLSTEERLKRKRQRTRYKNLINRFIKTFDSKKTVKTSYLLGYTQNEFVAHIEKMFKDGMSWDNRESFHVDHIKPISYFMRNGISDPKIINALSNLQPLYPQENMSKSDRI